METNPVNPLSANAPKPLLKPWLDKKKKVGKYLTVRDITKSAQANKLGIENEIQEEHWNAIQETAELFDKIKDKFPEAFPSSFYRSPLVNIAVKGSNTSQHLLGEAVDVDSIGDTINLAMFHFIRENFPFDQLILEYPDEEGIPDWVHVSTTKRRGNRGMVMVKLKSDPPKKYRPFSEYKIGMV